MKFLLTSALLFLIHPHAKTKFRYMSLNLIFRRRVPSKHVGDVFKCICGCFCIEFGCENGEKYCVAEMIQTFGIFDIFGGSLASPPGRTHFRKTHPTNKNEPKSRIPLIFIEFVLFCMVQPVLYVYNKRKLVFARACRF